MPKKKPASQLKPKKPPPKGGGRKPGKMTAKEERFCHEWLIDMNDTQAAIRTGYSKRSAGVIGHELLKKPKIRDHIDKLRHQALLKADLTLDMLVNELKHFGFYSAKDFIEEGNHIPDLSKMTREQLKPVIGIKFTETRSYDGTPVLTTELKFVDKRASVVDLIRHLGGFEKDNRQKQAKIVVTRK